MTQRAFTITNTDTNPATAGSGAAGASPIANTTPSTTSTGTADPVQTVADAYLAALGSQPTDPGATVVVPTPPADTSGDSSMNIKNIAILAGLALAGYLVYKKFVKGGTSSNG